MSEKPTMPPNVILRQDDAGYDQFNIGSWVWKEEVARLRAVIRRIAETPCTCQAFRGVPADEPSRAALARVDELMPGWRGED